MLKNIFDKFENMINESTDKFFKSWPFIYLRPKKDEEMTIYFNIKMALFLGGPTGMLSSLTLGWQFIFIMIMGMFICSMEIAYFWNRRAKRLQKLQNSIMGSEN